MDGFLCKSFFPLFGRSLSLGELVFLAVWRIKVPRKAKFFTWQVLHGRANTLDTLGRKVPLLFGPFGSIVCLKVEEDLD